MMHESQEHPYIEDVYGGTEIADGQDSMGADAAYISGPSSPFPPSTDEGSTKTIRSRVLFAPTTLAVMVFRDDDHVDNKGEDGISMDSTTSPHRVDRQVRVEIRDINSAWLVFYNDDQIWFDELKKELEKEKMQKVGDKISFSTSSAAGPTTPTTATAIGFGREEEDILTAFKRMNREKKKNDQGKLCLILDLLTDITKEREVYEEDRTSLSSKDGGGGTKVVACFYRYRRFQQCYRFEVTPLTTNSNADNTMGVQNLQAFDFLLSQYTMKRDSITMDGELAGGGANSLNNSGALPSHTTIGVGQDRNPNVVAKGLEDTGVVVRYALRSGGRYTGDMIRFLGKQYTYIVAPKDKPGEGDNNVNATRTGSNGQLVRNSDKYKVKLEDIDPKVLAKAQRRKEWAEGVHSGARTVTGTALYPVRWTGRKASEWANSHSTGQTTSRWGVRKAMWDTVGGLGNGMMSICKGITEALEEVGSAIGDSAIHHSNVIYGEDYTQHVTQCYVDAASEIGLASYKVVNVATFGVVGLTLDAVVEGVTLLVALYDYLIGPVILQGYMEMIQLPLTKPELFFVVLRPWSITFYRSAKDFVKKPYKIVPTSMLDTMPKLRLRPGGGATGEGDEHSAPISGALVEVRVSGKQNSSHEIERYNEDMRASGGVGVEVGVERDLFEDDCIGAELAEEELRDGLIHEEDVGTSNDHVEDVMMNFSSVDDMVSPTPLLYRSSEGGSGRGETTVPRQGSGRGKGRGTGLGNPGRGGNHQDIIRRRPSTIPTTRESISESDEMIEVLESEGVRYIVRGSNQQSSSQSSQSTTTNSTTTTKQEAKEEKKKRIGIRKKIASTLKNWSGGDRSHIELCTVDCSTFLLYPSNTELLTWYQELREASLRVETIAKRKSGAEEIATRRRLSLMPKTKLLKVSVKRFVMSNSHIGLNPSGKRKNHHNKHNIPITTEITESEAYFIDVDDERDNDHDDDDDGIDIGTGVDLEDYDMEDFFFDDIYGSDDDDEGGGSSGSGGIGFQFQQQPLELMQLRELHNPYRTHDITIGSSTAGDSGGNRDDDLPTSWNRTVFDSQSYDQHDQSVTLPLSATVSAEPSPQSRQRDNHDNGSDDIVIAATPINDVYPSPDPIVVTDVSGLPSATSTARSYRSGGRTRGIFHRLNRQVADLTEGLQRTYNDTTRVFLQVTCAPITTNGVRVTAEEFHSEYSPVYSLSEYSEKLEFALNHSLNLTRHNTNAAASSTTAANGYPGLSLFTVEDPNDTGNIDVAVEQPLVSALRQRQEEEKRERIIELLTMFNEVDQSKRIAEYEIDEVIHPLPEDVLHRRDYLYQEQSPSVPTIAVPGSGRSNANGVLDPVRCEKAIEPPSAVGSLVSYPTPATFSNVAGERSVFDNVNSFEMGRKASLFQAITGAISDDCHKIELRVKSKVLHSNLELGRGYVSMEDLLATGISEVWIPILHKRTSKQVGNLLVAFEICDFY